MLIRADPATNTISMLSFPRDLGRRRSTARSGNDRSACDRSTRPTRAAGPKGTLETVQAPDGLPINYLITVNFRGFRQIVDKIGGDLARHRPALLQPQQRHRGRRTSPNINLQPGYQRLSGAQALAFVRFRHTDDDYHRLARQQEFVRAFKEQVAQQLRASRELPSIVPSLITKNVEVGGKIERPGRCSSTRCSRRRCRAATSSRSRSRASPATPRRAPRRRIDPDGRRRSSRIRTSRVSKVANDAALGLKLEAEDAGAGAKTTVTVLNGNGVAGLGRERELPARPARLHHAAAARERWRRTRRRRTTSTRRSTSTRARRASKAAASALEKLVEPADVAAAAEGPGAARARPGRDAHGRRRADVPQPARDPAAAGAGRRSTSRRTCATTPSAGREPARAVSSDQVPFTLDGADGARALARTRTPATATRRRGSTGSTRSTTRRSGSSSAPAPASTGASRRPTARRARRSPTELPARGSRAASSTSTTRARTCTWSCCASHDASYWVVNTLLDSLSNETMLAIAKGLKPLPAGK